MSDDVVTFNIRLEKALFELKIKLPGDVSGFIEKLKNELKFEEAYELMILCPTPGGKMMEIQSDDDFEFLKKTKLGYNAVTKEVYCNVELVVTVIQELPDNTKTRFMMLSKEIDKLASKVNELSDDLTKKIDSNIRFILAEHFDLQIDPGSNSKNNSLSEKEAINIKLVQKKLNKKKFSSAAGTNYTPEFSLKPVEKKSKEEEKKLSSTAGTNDTPEFSLKPVEKKSKEEEKKLSSTAGTNDISSTKEDNHRNTDVLLKKLEADGYTNKIRNIIALKRFDGDYEIVKNYLSSSAVTPQSL